MLRGIATIVTALLVTISWVEARQTDTGLFATAPSISGDTPTGPAVARSRLVTIDATRLAPFRDPGPIAADAPSLALNLFPDQQFAARIDRVEPTFSGYVLLGQVASDANSSVALAVVDGVIAGKVAVDNELYVITHVANGVHVIQQVEQAQLPPESPPLTPPPADRPLEAPPGVADDASTIDLLVVYTPAAATLQGGTSSIRALIELGVSETNQAYANSGVSQRLRLVHRAEIAYTESGNMSTDLGRLRSTSDGFMDGVHTLRNTYGADLVQLLVNSNDFCGVAYLMTGSNVNSGFAPHAFGVTQYSCVSPNLTFAHEMGHNMGLHHDAYQTGASYGAYPYSRGYVNQAAFVGGADTNKRWRDIMAYNDQCAASGFFCSRLLYFSNPLNLYTGDPMGHGSTADGVRTLNETALIVANFRTSTVPSFTDPTVAAGATAVKAVHVTELRARIDALRVARGLDAYTWTDASLSGSAIKAVHIAELRTALDQAYLAAKQTAPSYTDPSLTGVFVKAVHVTELRAAVIALETL